MPRKIVPLLVGEKFHVFNRGVDKRTIFERKEDYVRFYMSLDLFNSTEPITNYDHAQAAHRENRLVKKLVSIEAYALLPNHFHLVISPLVDGGIGEFLRRVCGGYTNYFNDKHDRSGALFQGTFKRVHIATDEQYQYLFAYVNENHLVHGIERPAEIMYSSSLHFQGLAKSRLIGLRTQSVVYVKEENEALARSIYERRKKQKLSDLLE